jgi:hypothetical protein
LILGSGETDVLAVVNHLNTVFELFKDVDRTVRRSVVDDDDFFPLVLLS